MWIALWFFLSIDSKLDDSDSKYKRFLRRCLQYKLVDRGSLLDRVGLVGFNKGLLGFGKKLNLIKRLSKKNKYFGYRNIKFRKLKLCFKWV
jgi:hypothetical protein